MAKTPPPSLAALARHRLRNLPAEEQQTPEERRQDNEELLQMLQQVRPDLHALVAPFVSGSDEDWFPLIERKLGKQVALGVVEVFLEQES